MTPPTRPSLTTETGAMKEGVPSLIAIIFGILLTVFAMSWAMIALLITKAHSTADDIVVGSCLLVAFICVLPANFQKAVSVLGQFVPFRRKDD